MEALAGERLPVAGDLTSGVANTAAISGWPTSRVVNEGEPILCDLDTRANGYWGDSCNTIFLGEPGPDFMKLYTTTQQAIEVVQETLKPGVVAADFDRKVRSVFEEPGSTTRFTPVTASARASTMATNRARSGRHAPGGNGAGGQEPGAYDPAVGGVRLEWMFLVTGSGNEVLSGFPHTLHSRHGGSTESPFS